MRRFLWVGFWVLAMLSLAAGCAPAPTNSFAGVWTTNVGMVSFSINGNEITGAIQGYGGVHNYTFKGTINDTGEAFFNTDWFGEFSLILVGDTFRSKSNERSFCGVRGTEELPSGCGFSGTWIVPPKFVFLEGSTMVLKQVGDQVTGELLDGSGKAYDTFDGVVYWGKGWMARGTSEQRGELTLAINAAETGFEFLFGTAGNRQQLCAVREGQSSAYLGSFTCTP